MSINTKGVWFYFEWEFENQLFLLNFCCCCIGSRVKIENILGSIHFVLIKYKLQNKIMFN